MKRFGTGEVRSCSSGAVPTGNDDYHGDGEESADCQPTPEESLSAERDPKVALFFLADGPR